MNFFTNFDWNSFWMNVLVSGIFLIIGIPIAIKTIPHYTLKLIKTQNKKHIVRKLSSLIHEICDYLDMSPYRDEELNQEQLAIYTNKEDIKNYRFVGLVDINVFNGILHPKIYLVVVEYFKKLEPNIAYEKLKEERDRLKLFRYLLENIINIHALHVDDKIISEVSELCLDIRIFEIRYKRNNVIDDLILEGVTVRKHIFGIDELAKIYQSILKLLLTLANQKGFEFQIQKNS